MKMIFVFISTLKNQSIQNATASFRLKNIKFVFFYFFIFFSHESLLQVWKILLQRIHLFDNYSISLQFNLSEICFRQLGPNNFLQFRFRNIFSLNFK